MTRKKKQSPQEIHNIQYWRDHDWSPTILEKFPRVKRISIEVTTRPEASWMGAVETKTHHFDPAAKAFFRFRCRYQDCVAGGINLGEKVSELISQQKSQLSGTDYCQGWQDEERMNRFHCHLQHDYAINVLYPDS